MEAAAMNPVLASVQSLMQIFVGKSQAFCSEIENVHMVWLEEIQQEANRMFTKDFNAEPELMPKTPSQKRNTRRKRVSLGRQEESQTRRRFSKGRRSNLRGSSSNDLNCIAEEENTSQGSSSKIENTRPKRATRKKQTKAEEEEAHQSLSICIKSDEVVPVKAQVIEILEYEVEEQKDTAVKNEKPSSITESPKNIPSPIVVVAISPQDRLSAELAVEAETSPGHAAVEAKAAEPAQNNRSRRSSVGHSLKLRHSVAGLRCSLTQESVRRASRRSMLKRKTARMGSSTCGSNTGDDSCMDSVDEENEEMETSEPVEPVADTLQTEENTEETASVNKTVLPPLQPVGRITRSVAANSPKLAPQPLFAVKIATPDKRAEKQPATLGRLSTKRKAPDVEESPTKRASPPKKSHSAIKPHMKSFLHTVQKNQMLMMTPSSLGRSTVLKSFIKHNTPLKVEQKTSSGIVTKERYKLEALKKKQEQEIERIKKMEEEKKKKQEELKKKRDERQRRVFEAKEQKEEEKKKKIEQKLAQIDEKNDKRLADEKKKKVLAMKRQEELELKKKEEEAKKKFQQEEEKRQQEAKKKAEEEERAQKLVEAHKALELKREHERERERERQAAAERDRVEREKALALQRELERAAREKERRELEERRKALEEKRKLENQLKLAAEEKAAKQAPPALNVTVDIEHSVMSTPVSKTAGLNVTVDVEKSPQSYSITPKGGNKIPSKNPEDYGMDQNSDDSTDDESAPRKPIPSWAEGHNLQLLIKRQYFAPPKLDAFFGKIEPPNLENIFNKSKPRYFKRTSSAVWHSPPGGK